MGRRNLYGYATPLERDRATRRVNARHREYRRRGQTFRPPPGLDKAERRQWYRDLRKWLNHSPGRNGVKEDREYGNIGLSDENTMTPDEVDMHMKMVQSRVEYEARQQGLRLGKRGREAVRRAFTERLNG